MTQTQREREKEIEKIWEGVEAHLFKYMKQHEEGIIHAKDNDLEYSGIYIIYDKDRQPPEGTIHAMTILRDDVEYIGERIWERADVYINPFTFVNEALELLQFVLKEEYDIEMTIDNIYKTMMYIVEQGEVDDAAFIITLYALWAGPYVESDAWWDVDVATKLFLYYAYDVGILKKQ